MSVNSCSFLHIKMDNSSWDAPGCVPQGSLQGSHEPVPLDAPGQRALSNYQPFCIFTFCVDILYVQEVLTDLCSNVNIQYINKNKDRLSTGTAVQLINKGTGNRQSRKKKRQKDSLKNKEKV